MPREVIVLQVFLSSPSDVREERDLVQDIVDELNTTWRTNSNIQLNLLMWEKDARPTLVSDAQTAINTQLGHEYDIFIGIMGARFGSPTPRAESGTEEEFEHARARFEKNPDDVSVMFYFKDAPPASLSEIDPKQLERVQAFKQKLQSLGLVRVFKQRDEFARLIRINLSQEVQAWSKRLTAGSIHREPIASEVTTLENQKSVIEEAEEGYLDLIEQGEEAFQTLVQTIGRISSAVQDVGVNTEQRTKDIEAINAKAAATNTPADLKAIKRITNQVAIHLEELVTRLDAETPIFASGFKRAIDPLTKAISMPDIKSGSAEEFQVALTSIKKMIGSQEDAISKYRGLRDTVASTPRMTTALNRAKRRAVDSLNKLIDEFEKALRVSREFLDFLTSTAARKFPK
jgi:hypothetical protein